MTNLSDILRTRAQNESQSPKEVADMSSRLTSVLDDEELPVDIVILDRLARAHDASHYLLVPSAVVRPSNVAQIGAVFRKCGAHGVSVDVIPACSPDLSQVVARNSADL